MLEEIADSDECAQVCSVYTYIGDDYTLQLKFKYDTLMHTHTQARQTNAMWESIYITCHNSVQTVVVRNMRKNDIECTFAAALRNSQF